MDQDELDKHTKDMVAALLKLQTAPPLGRLLYGDSTNNTYDGPLNITPSPLHDANSVGNVSAPYRVIGPPMNILPGK